MKATGLYDPAYEHDACGVAVVARLDGIATHEAVARALTALSNLEHRGAAGADADTGDGAGILVQMPDAFLRGRVVKTSFLGSQTRIAVSCDAVDAPLTAAEFGRDRSIERQLAPDREVALWWESLSRLALKSRYKRAHGKERRYTKQSAETTPKPRVA